MTFKTQVEYLAERVDRPVYYASSAGRDAAHKIDQQMNIVTVEVDDARRREGDSGVDAYGMHASGFDLHEMPTRVDDFQDADQLGSIYNGEIESFLRRTTGAYRVHIFDHTVRASDPEIRGLKQLREPAFLVHNDYTPTSGFVCLQENLGDEAQALSRQRFQIVNVWRPLVDPVEDYPLALCDARSLKREDLVTTERRAPNHSGEIQLAVHDAQQRWYYFSDMRPGEVLLFKTFDSIDGGQQPCSIHSAIRLPHAAADARPRESVEVRAFLFFREDRK